MILHVDLDAFFAAVEVLRHPELAGKAVVIGGRGDPAERAVVSTASYEARRYGIYSGMPLRTAWRRCPQATFLPVDYPAYVRVAHRLREIFHRFSHRVEPAGLDEAFLQVGRERDAEQIGYALKAQIRAELHLQCSVGIGPNKLLAKMASELAKPGGLVRLTQSDVPHRIWPLPVRALPGIGPRTAAALAREGIHSLGDLAQRSRPWLTERFGPHRGEFLHDSVRGLDDAPVGRDHRRRSLGREHTFQTDLPPTVVAARMEAMARRLAARLRQYHYRARTITVKVRFADFHTVTRAVSLESATDDAAAIVAAARRALERLAADRPVRLLGVRASRLDTQSP